MSFSLIIIIKMQDGLCVIVPICLILSCNLFLILCLILGHQILVLQISRVVYETFWESSQNDKEKREAIKNKEDEW